MIYHTPMDTHSLPDYDYNDVEKAPLVITDSDLRHTEPQPKENMKQVVISPTSCAQTPAIYPNYGTRSLIPQYSRNHFP